MPGARRRCSLTWLCGVPCRRSVWWRHGAGRKPTVCKTVGFMFFLATYRSRSAGQRPFVSSLEDSAEVCFTLPLHQPQAGRRDRVAAQPRSPPPAAGHASGVLLPPTGRSTGAEITWRRSAEVSSMHPIEGALHATDRATRTPDLCHWACNVIVRAQEDVEVLRLCHVCLSRGAYSSPR